MSVEQNFAIVSESTVDSADATSSTWEGQIAAPDTLSGKCRVPSLADIAEIGSTHSLALVDKKLNWVVLDQFSDIVVSAAQELNQAVHSRLPHQFRLQIQGLLLTIHNLARHASISVESDSGEFAKAQLSSYATSKELADQYSTLVLTELGVQTEVAEIHTDFGVLYPLVVDGNQSVPEHNVSFGDGEHVSSPDIADVVFTAIPEYGNAIVESMTIPNDQELHSFTLMVDGVPVKELRISALRDYLARDLRTLDESALADWVLETMVLNDTVLYAVNLGPDTLMEISLNRTTGVTTFKNSHTHPLGFSVHLYL